LFATTKLNQLVTKPTTQSSNQNKHKNKQKRHKNWVDC